MLTKTLFFYFLSLLFISNKERIKLSGHAQGTTWNIVYYDTVQSIRKSAIDSIFNSIDSSVSLYKPYSKIVAFNNSNIGIEADAHLKNIVRASLITSNETNGLFDITIGPLTEIWGFTSKQSESIPDNKEIRSLLPCVGSENIFIRNDSLVKLKPCVKIDVNGIAQGYTVDVIAAYLSRNKINNYLVEVGGEVRVSGTKSVNTPFKVGIESPSVAESSNPPMQKVLALKEGAITTSGNYKKFHESKGKKYSHIIDPRTGYSVQNSIISVTVFAKDATTADAYDNALMLMGVRKALKFVESHPAIAAFIIYKKPDGSIADTASSRFPSLSIIEH